MGEKRAVFGIFTDKDGNNITIDVTSDMVQKYLEEHKDATLEVAIGSVIEELNKQEFGETSNDDTSEDEE